MRHAIKHLKTPAHFGLAYDMWVPEEIAGEFGDQAKVDSRKGWLNGLEDISIDKDYTVAFDRWQKGLAALRATQVEVTSISRLLVGHGNPSGSDVGLTVQHTWGVPMIPGSSLKGLLQHHLAAKYGPDPDHWKSHPLDQNHPESERAPFQSAHWDDRSIVHSPGLAIRTIFGAPAADSDNQTQWSDSGQVGAAKGSLQFLDAWWKPDERRKPFAADILNVHQRKYYGQDGRQSWPNDYDAPVPVQFMTVEPSQIFLLAICGEESLANWAMGELVEALDSHGIGGKTSAGYGLLVANRGAISRKVEVESSPVLDDLKKCLTDDRLPPAWDIKMNQRQILDFIKDTMLKELLKLNMDQREEAAKALKKKFGGHKKLKDEAKKLMDQLISVN